MTRRKKPFENIVGKGENAGNHYFLLFPQCILPYQKQKSSFELQNNKVLDSFKLKEFADDNSRFEEYGRKSS